jgi:hypothetical protein
MSEKKQEEIHIPMDEPSSSSQLNPSRKVDSLQTIQERSPKAYNYTDNQMRQEVIHDLIQPTIVTDIKTAIRNRFAWNVIGHIFETSSKILLASSGILSFASGYYKRETLSFVSGSVCTMSLACAQFASYSFRESKKNSENLNLVLKKMKIQDVPVIDFAVQSPSNKHEQN